MPKTVFSASLRYILHNTDHHIFQGDCDENVLELLQTVSFQDLLDNYRTRQPNAVIQEIWLLIYGLLASSSPLVRINTSFSFVADWVTIGTSSVCVSQPSKSL